MFDFVITIPNEKVLYVMSNDDNLIDSKILYKIYNNYKNLIFIDNLGHGDIFLYRNNDKIFKEIIKFYN